MVKSSYHHGALESALIDAALVLIEEQGAEDFSLAAAARRAGVSSAAPYRHFTNRRDLLNAVARRGFIELGERLQAVSATSGNTDTDADDTRLLLEQGLAYIQFAVDKPALFRVVFDARGRDPQHNLGLAALAVLGETLSRLDVNSGLRVPLAIAMRACWAAVHGVATLTINGMRTFSEEDSDTIRRQLLTPLLAGIVRLND